MNNKLIPYGKQTVKKDDVKSVIKTLNSDYLTTGPTAKKFENDFVHFLLVLKKNSLLVFPMGSVL